MKGTVVSKKEIRVYGQYFTPIEIFKTYILPEIKDKLYNYLWVDLFAGEGNLILPILDEIPSENKIDFFRDHIYLFDIHPEMVERAVQNAIKYGIPEKLAREKIKVRDTIANYPEFILQEKFPVYHITNPPYLYLGNISKNKNLDKYLKYFEGENEGYQDLYQLALINDLRHNIPKMIYIIPSNFLFGSSVSNKIRKDFLSFYNITKAIIFEKKIFKHTGTHTVICFFERKDTKRDETQKFKALKLNSTEKSRIYILKPKYHYRAGTEFKDFCSIMKVKNPIKVKFYLFLEDIKKNIGNCEIKVLDVNEYTPKGYRVKNFKVNNSFCTKIKNNILFIRTLDTGTKKGKAGLYVIKEIFGVDGLLVSKAPYRTHPIQLFLYPTLSYQDQIFLKDYFNLILDYFRKLTDSEFMTTYKYSQSEYTRKYLGLTQVKDLIATFPILELTEESKKELKTLVYSGNAEEVINFLYNLNKRGRYYGIKE